SWASRNPPPEYPAPATAHCAPPKDRIRGENCCATDASSYSPVYIRMLDNDAHQLHARLNARIVCRIRVAVNFYEIQFHNSEDGLKSAHDEYTAAIPAAAQPGEDMYYEPGVTRHGLPYDPLKPCVVPRPLGCISTLAANGVATLAPYSQLHNITFDPPIVTFSANQTIAGSRKDTTVNAERAGSFVWNM